MAAPITDTVFNWNTSHQGPRTGYTRQQRNALQGPQLQKIQEAATAKVFDSPLSAMEEITSFDPEELLKSTGKTNFFVRVTSWREQVALMQKHCESYYMNNVFMIGTREQVQAVDANGHLRWETHQVQRRDATGALLVVEDTHPETNPDGSPVYETVNVHYRDPTTGQYAYAMDPANPLIRLQIDGKDIPIYVPQVQLDGSGNPIQSTVTAPRLDAAGNMIPLMHTVRRQDTYGNDIPFMETIFNEIGMLWDIWNSCTADQVLESCRLYFHHGEDVDRQNMAWSYDFILNNVDTNLKHYILSECTNKEVAAQSGPYAFFLLARKLMSATSNFAHNVNSGLHTLQLRHFQGEDVVECIFVLRHILRVLNHGVEGIDQTPPNLMTILFDIFQQCSNVQFRSYMQQLRDFHKDTVDTPEELFSRAQSYFTDITTSPTRQWLRTRKPKAAFVNQSQGKSSYSARHDHSQSCAHSSSSPSSTTSDSQSSSPSKKKKPIDRTPPEEGEPHTRKNAKGFDEHFCFECPDGGRWGNHLTKDHKEWLAKYRESQRIKREKAAAAKEEAETSTPTVDEASPKHAPNPSASPGPSSMRRGSANQATVTSSAFKHPFRRSYVSFEDSDDESF